MCVIKKSSAIFLFVTLFAIFSAHTVSADIISNYDDQFSPLEEVAKIQVERNIYDIGYVVYSKEFADRYGYVYDYVVPMDKGMHMLEFRMRTEGTYTVCYLRAILDNNLDLDVPKQNLHYDLYPPRLPGQREELKDPKGLRGYYESPENQQFRIFIREDKREYYNRNIHLATMDYEFRGRNPAIGAAEGTRLIEYDKTYYRDMDLFVFSIGCASDDMIIRDNSSIWFKKTQTRDYRKVAFPKPEDFIKFKIPRKFATKITEFMQLSHKDTGTHIIHRQLEMKLK